MLGLLVALAGAVVLVLALTKGTKFSYQQTKFTAEFGNNFNTMNTLELKDRARCREFTPLWILFTR